MNRCIRPECYRHVPMNKRNDSGLCPRCTEIAEVFRWLIGKHVIRRTDEAEREVSELAKSIGLVLPNQS